MIYERARVRPNEIAVDDLSSRRTWAELADRATRVARLLREDLGVAPGEHAAILISNRTEYVEITLGGMLAGIWLTPINGHLAAEEIRYIVRDSGARVVFSDSQHEAIVREAGTPLQIGVGEELDRALAQASDAPLDPDGPSGGTMIYTSGTTGYPKGVKRSRPATLAAALRAFAAGGRRIGLNGSGPHLVTGPMYHAAPLLFAIYDQLNGAPIVILPRWDARQTLELLQQREIAHTHLVPTMFVRLLRLPEKIRQSFEAPRLELVLHGAAPISIRVKRQMIEWWGEKLVEYWGATEAGVNTWVDSADWLLHPGTVGRALPAFEIFAVDDQGRRRPAGEIGPLYCRHRAIKQVFHYHGDAKKTAEAYLEPGVFTIGDIGSVDEDGWVYLADRKSNMIISGGVNIYPAEIAQVIQQHPAVADVAVFGIPDDEWGESVKAAIELSGGYTPGPELVRSILDFARTQLARYKIPRSIDFERSLPRQPSGKLYVRRLREPYWRGRTRHI